MQQQSSALATVSFRVDSTSAPFTDHASIPKFVLTLYVAGGGPCWDAAVERLDRICKNDLAERWEIQFVDILDRPELSGDERILAPDAVMLWLAAPLQRPLREVLRARMGLVGLGFKRTNRWTCETEY